MYPIPVIDMFSGSYGPARKYLKRVKPEALEVGDTIHLAPLRS